MTPRRHYSLPPRARLRSGTGGACTGIRTGEVSDAEVLRAIRSVPVHHSGMGLLLGVDTAPPAGGGGGSWALLAHSTASNSSSSGIGSFTTGAIDTTGATILASAVGWYNGGSPPSISDSRGNSYTALTSHAGGNGSITMFYSLAPAVGVGHTLTVASAAFASVVFAAFSGGGSALDAQNGAGSASATTQQPGSITPAVSGELLLSGLGFASPNLVSIDSSYAIADQFVSNATVFGSALAWLSGGAGATDPTWTQATTERMTAAIAAFLS